jgi:hypothetical protein
MSETKGKTENEKRALSVSEISLYFNEILKSAPSYGWCGMNVTFHDGRPVKIEKNVCISIKPEAIM